MTEAELAASAANHAKRTTISWADFLDRVAHGRYTPAQLRATEWTKAGTDLEAIKHLPATPPAPADNLAVVRNLLVWATVTDDAIQQACRLPASWRFCFSADPAYRVTDQQIAAVRASGHHCYAWGDCHTIWPTDIQRFAQARKLEGWYGEGESSAAFTVATLDVPSIEDYEKPIGVIVNLSALATDQLAQIAAGWVLVTAELYRNVQPWMQPDWRNANQGIGSNLVAVYASASEGARYMPISEYVADGMFDKTRDSVYTESMRTEDWQALL